MAVRPTSPSLRVGERFEVLTAAAYTLYNRSGKPQACVRRIHCYNAATISVMKDSGENDSPPGAVPAGTVIDADVSAITFTGGPIMVCW